MHDAKLLMRIVLQCLPLIMQIRASATRGL